VARAGSILVVDDELPIVDALSDALLWEGYPVVTAHNGQRALEELARAEVSLVLLDCMMPVMDGLMALERIRAEPAWRVTPVVLMTAATPPDCPCDSDGILQKPFEVSALFDLVRRLAGPPPGKDGGAP
jgi:CheY-like chemotaxis protein